MSLGLVFFFLFGNDVILFKLGSVDAGAGTGISGLLRQHNLHGWFSSHRRLFTIEQGWVLELHHCASSLQHC